MAVGENQCGDSSLSATKQCSKTGHIVPQINLMGKALCSLLWLEIGKK
jgi:hypothetical protein